MSNYSSSDDDIFDYEPDEEKLLVSSSSTSNSHYSTLENDVLNSIKNNLDEVESTPVHGDKARFAIAFYAATAKFINVGENQSYVKASRMVLDTLTNGEFSLLQTFYEYEIKISRKMSFLSIFGDSFLIEDKETLPDFAKEVLDILNIDANLVYINSCFRTVINITQHSLLIDRYMYKHLSVKLNIPVKEYLFINPSEMNTDDHNVYLENFHYDVYEKVYASLITPDLLSELSNDFQTNVTFKKNYEE